MIEAQDLVKWFGPTLAVDHVSFQIPRGQIVGFLGPNGAGKSTSLRILTGYLPPSAGRAVIDGCDVANQSRAARRRIGYMPENAPLYPEMRVTEYLDYRGRLMRMVRADRRRRIDEVCNRCGLDPVKRRTIGTLSKGNRQRVALAQALLHQPPVLILDEPTAGLDPNQITAVRSLIAELRGDHTVLLSSHILPEIERTADRVIIIAGGRIVAEGEPDELRRKVASGSRLLMEVKAATEPVREALVKVKGVTDVELAGDNGWTRARIALDDRRGLRDELAELVAARGWPVREMRPETASLEQFFVEITAAQDRAAGPAEPLDAETTPATQPEAQEAKP